MAQISFPVRREGTREAISADDDAVEKGDLHLVAIATRENNRGKGGGGEEEEKCLHILFHGFPCGLGKHFAA